MTKKTNIVFLLFIVLFVAIHANAEDRLRDGFQNPPDSAKLWAYWWWLNGNVTEESITSDLEGMKAKGFGGAIVFDADGSSQEGNVRAPAGPMFASPEWRKLFVHTLKEADRLGLSISLNLQSGWNLGGPGVKPEHAGLHVSTSEIKVDGPGEKTITLPKPRAVNGFYRDVILLAYPNRPRDVSGEPEITAEASSSQDNFPPANAIDGNSETYWVSGGNDPQKPVSPQTPQSISVSFGESVEADRIIVRGRSGYGPKEIELFAREPDGKEWKSLGKLSCKNDGGELKFPSVKSNSFKMTVYTSNDPRFPNSPRNVQIVDFNVLKGEKTLGKRATSGTKPISNLASRIVSREVGFSVPDCLPLVLDEPSVPGEEAAEISEVKIIDAKINEKDEIKWNVPEGSWTIIRFGYTQSGSRVSTSSGEWQGFTLNYLDPVAFETYWKENLEPIFKDAGKYNGKVLRYLHTDSWEAGGMNWTPGFIEEFEKRRGYDPSPYLPILAGKIIENRSVSIRFLNDFRRTVADCIKDNHYALMKEYALKYGIGIHPESGGPHGGPFDSLELLGLSDIPMSEYWSWSPRHRVGDQMRFFLKQPASAAHTYGKRLVAAEGFTNIGMHWQESFSDNLKPSFDQALCEGMNLLVWHAFTSSPKKEGLPGQEYFAGTHFNPNNFTFQKSDEFLKYINRSQFLLQQGNFFADVLEFYGENAPNFTQRKWADTARSLPGYDFDVATEEVLLKRVTVKNGEFVLPDGTKYKVLVLPERNSISASVLHKIRDWVIEEGASVLGPKPQRITGLRGFPDTDVIVRKIADELWGTETPKPGEPFIRKAGKGRIAYGMTSHELLKKDELPYDFERIEGTNPQARLDSIHRIVYKNQAKDINLSNFADFSAKDIEVFPADFSSGIDSHIYFTANLSGNPDKTVCAFRVSGLMPEFWDPLTGKTWNAKAFTQENGRTFVPIEFEGFASIFVIFRKPIDTYVSGTAKDNSMQEVRTWKIPGPWEVSFDEALKGPKSVKMEKLDFWNKNDDLNIRNYSGIGTYRKSFEVPEAFIGTKNRLFLRIGDLAELAEVKLNGRSLGILWAKPYEIEVSGFLRKGENELEIEVANHWVNRVVGDLSLPESERITKTNIRKLSPETPLIDSGISGEIELRELAP